MITRNLVKYKFDDNTEITLMTTRFILTEITDHFGDEVLNDELNKIKSVEKVDGLIDNNINKKI